MATNEQSDIQARYKKLETKRQPYVDRAKEFASLTLPYIMPASDDDWSGSGKLQLDWQSYGAKVCNHLANRYMMTQFPAGQPFFRLDVDDALKAQLYAQHGPAAVDYIFAMAERKAGVTAFEALSPRQALLEAFKHLIICGNTLVYIAEEGAVQTYALNQYVVKRDLNGRVFEIITLDYKDTEALDEETKNALRTSGVEVDNEDKDVKLYTRIWFDTEREMWVVNQAIETFAVGEEITFKDADQRWFPLRWTASRNEQYGRSLVEEHSGNFNALSILTQALAEGAVAMTDIKYLVDTAAAIDVEALNNSASGTYVPGRQDAIGAVQSNKHADFNFVAQLIENYKQEIAAAFLVAEVRDSERTTAEEVRLLARELETSHGGTYSGLAADLQMPFARYLMKQTNPELAGAAAQPTIVTGLDALGRAGDLEAMRGFLQDLGLLNTVPESIAGAIKPIPFTQTLAALWRVDFSGWIMSEDEQEQKAQAEQANAMRQTLTQEGAKGLAGLMANANPEQLAEAAPIAQQALSGTVGG